MNPARNYNERKPTEDGCEICGFMKPDFEDDENLYRNYRRREPRGIAEGSGSGRSSLDTFYPTSRQQEPKIYENHACSSFNAEVRPNWLREELVRLFHEARNPAPPYKFNEPGCASSSPSDSSTLLDLRHLLPNCYTDADHTEPNHPLSQQQPPGLAPLSLQLQAASIMARDNCAPPQHMQLFPDHNTTTSVQPYRNTVLSEETLPSNTEKLYKSQTIPKPSSHEELPYTKFGTKEMSSSMKTSETTPLTAYLSPTSNTSSTDIMTNEWKLMKHLSNKRQEEKQSLIDSNVSGTSCKNGNAHGGRSKKTNTVPGTSASGQLQEFSQLSLSTEGGKQWCTFCAKNGETEEMVKSHKLYNSKTNHLQCPILRAHHCEACNATGDFAHTRSHCPRISMQKGKGKVMSTALALKSTPRLANGKLRKSKAKDSHPN